MHTINPLRSSGFIWSIRFLQVIFAVVLLVITAQDASTWHDNDCITPPKLAYHIAMAVVTLPPLAYFLFCTGPVSFTRFWSPWTQIVLDLLFFMFWIVAASLTNYDCNGLCQSCSANSAYMANTDQFTIYAGNMVCDCLAANDYNSEGDNLVTDGNPDGSNWGRRKLTMLFLRSLVPRQGSGDVNPLTGDITEFNSSTSGGAGSGSGSGGVDFNSSSADLIYKVAEKAGNISARKGLDASLIVLFFITLFTTLYLRYSGPRVISKSAARNASAGGEEGKISIGSDQTDSMHKSLQGKA